MTQSNSSAKKSDKAAQKLIMGNNISHFRFFIPSLSLDDMCYFCWTALAIRSGSRKVE